MSRSLSVPRKRNAAIRVKPYDTLYVSDVRAWERSRAYVLCT